jgi:hypothetical protein
MSQFLFGVENKLGARNQYFRFAENEVEEKILGILP